MGPVRTLDLYVVRHGLTKANIEKRYIGHLDEPVMEERMEEMFELKKSLSTVTFDACFTSDRRRCLQTLHYLRPDLQGWKDVRLREISFGKWEGKRHEDLVQDPSYQRWLKDWQNTGPDGGERFPEFHDRVGVFLKEMVPSSYDQILLVTHGGVIRSLYQHLHPEASFWDISPPHGKGYYFRVTKSEEGWSCTSWSEVPVQENENTSENTSLL
ncbi:UNVERIFIED_CONTAM: histidine phosphatase family protein [Halobacillus marinus]